LKDESYAVKCFKKYENRPPGLTLDEEKEKSNSSEKS
jgi:hypothetical protein